MCYDPPRIVRRSANEQASKRWMVGPAGQRPGQAIVLVRLLDGNGGLGCAKGPHSTETSYETNYETNYTLRRDRVLALPSDGGVRHLASLEDCFFVALSYKTEFRDVLAEDYDEEERRVIPWMRD